MHSYFSEQPEVHRQARGRTLFLCCCAIAFLFIADLRVFAQEGVSRIDELKQNISNNEAAIEELEREIAEYKTKLTNIGTQKQTLQGAIQEIDLTRAKLGKDTKLTEAKIVRTSNTVASLNEKIVDKEARIKDSRKVIASTLRELNEADSETLLEVILRHGTLSDFFTNLDNLANLQTSIRDHIQTLERYKKDLGAQKLTYQDQQRELSALKARLVDQKKLADQERQKQSTLLSTTKNQESTYKKLLAEKETRKKQFEREIADFEAQLRAEVDPSTFPPPGTKVLSYPLEEVYVTQKFGKTVDARRLYLSGTHNGMDFRAAPGTPIYAAAEGTVIGIGDTDKVCPGASYGRWVLVRHRNGLSTMYAHLELIKVASGQSVTAGTLLGYSGSTGYATGPHLHFSVLVSSVLEIVDLPSKSCPKAVFHIPVAPAKGYVDPESYL